MVKDQQATLAYNLDQICNPFSGGHNMSVSTSSTQPGTTKVHRAPHKEQNWGKKLEKWEWKGLGQYGPWAVFYNLLWQILVLVLFVAGLYLLFRGFFPSPR